MARLPAQLSKQIDSLRAYLRTAHANYNRAYRELSAFSGKRRTCPFEVELRYRRFQDAARLLKLTELCLAELRHQRALRLAPFQPGDQIRVSTTIKGYEPDPRRYLVLDVEWRKGDACIYVVHELTKIGRLHRGRYRTWVHPSSNISIEPCSDALDKETVWRAASEREGAKERRSDALERGKLELFDEEMKRSR